MGDIITICFQTTCREPGVITWVAYTFWKGCPLKFGRAKKRPKPERFLTTFEFDRENVQTLHHFCVIKYFLNILVKSAWLLTHIR